MLFEATEGDREEMGGGDGGGSAVGSEWREERK